MISGQESRERFAANVNNATLTLSIVCEEGSRMKSNGKLAGQKLHKVPGSLPTACNEGCEGDSDGSAFGKVRCTSATLRRDVEASGGGSTQWGGGTGNSFSAKVSGWIGAVHMEANEAPC